MACRNHDTHRRIFCKLVPLQLEWMCAAVLLQQVQERHMARSGFDLQGWEPYRVRHRAKPVSRMRSTATDWLLNLISGAARVHMR